MTKKNEKERFDFEQALRRLGEVLKQLESDDVPLEQAIALYEEGMQLSKLCSGKLEEAELRIEQVGRKEQNHHES